MGNVYAKVVNQQKFKKQLTFSVLDNKYGEENEQISEEELRITSSIAENLRQSEMDKFDNQWTLENRKQAIEMQKSGWIFTKIDTMGKSFYKPGDTNGSSFVNFPLRSSATLNFENIDNYCFLWSILAKLHPFSDSKNREATRVSKHSHYFDELNVDGFNFSNRFTCSHMHRLEKMNNLAINIFEINFYHDQDKWQHNLILIEINENDSDGVRDVIIYQKINVLIEKLKVFLGKQDCR